MNMVFIDAEVIQDKKKKKVEKGINGEMIQTYEKKIYLM